MDKKYIGTREVLFIEIVAKKENDVVELVNVKFTDDSSEIMSKMMCDFIIKDKPTDLTTLRMDRMVGVSRDILAIMLQWGVKVGEVNFLLGNLSESINQSMDEVSKKIWGKENGDITFIDLDNRLKG